MSETKHGSMTITKGDHGLTADRTLWATVDGRVVEDGDPDANELIARAGQVIPREAIEKFGLEESHGKKKAKAEEDAAPETASKK